MTITPASIRTNNPGAMYPGPSASKFGSTSFEVLRSNDGKHKIAKFPSPVHGAAAQFDLLMHGKDPLGRYRYRGKTIREAITTWCGGFYSTTYLKVLEEKGGIKATDRLTEQLLLNPDVTIPLARAMAWQEAGRDFPIDEASWRDAHAMALGNAKAPGFSPDNDVPSPKPETRLARVATKVKVVATGVGTSAVGVVATTGVPPPPEVITQTVSNVSAWKSIIGNPDPFVIAGVLIVAGIFGIPWLLDRWRDA